MNKPVLSVIGKTSLELGSGPETNFGNWRLRRDESGVAWAIVDCKDTGTNTLSETVLTDLSQLLEAVEADLPKALVVRSAKPGGFIAGADVSEFRGASDEDAIAERLRAGHGVIDRLEALKCPTIAVVHGFALGGGFELALACDYRIAIDGAWFGFPEVRLGLHPGLGGTFRLSELIDPTEAMTLMLTGKSAHTKKAKKLGIADEITQERHLRAAVAAFARKDGKQHNGRGFKAAVLDLGPARNMAAGRMRSQTEEKAPREHYPAPHALIGIWESHGGDRSAMQQAEIRSFAHLITTDTAQNLIRVFFLREKLKKNGDGKSGVTSVHIVGAGTMGAEIAAWCAIKGFRVTISDIELEPLGKAVEEAARTARKEHLSDIEIRDVLDRLMPDPRSYGLGEADLIIEAAPEKPDLKRELLTSIDERAREDAVIATNTSSLELGGLASVLKNPGRFAGLHFFNPVSKLELVEVVSHPQASAETLALLNAFTGEIDRLPTPVRTYPGFLVNRILTPYLLEAALMVDEDIEPAAIDQAAERFGMPMGPLEVADRVGLDICLDVADSLRDKLEKPIAEIPGWMRKRVEKGELGEKSGQGIYAWKDGEPQKSKANDEMSSVNQDRLILSMLNAAVECLREGVVGDPDTLDAAMIFATGFAPFRGGPIHYARQRGPDEIVVTLEELARRHGPRFAPDEGWKDIGKE
ncbi:3-hydroxyacyl-CoA dehydrogenase NAD-binding domain-containing protein [Roseibium salinum]|uniref:enoyl-CoA hydratase n=1 Tax=Roseibium salinum TaxID=1604349 RepID=A0ABT3R4H6_9HYPH|nr:3-hydroxyacyl-CoA dehydrogenase NAD-binding domain-containing protein [Roseibium sp. DSM 29163]MCX2723968.1 3-hydroxyacyl-CoA dehydrogenase NAD-binding domain-containing protein [Roseibium sp. DSM 29163]